MDRQREPGCWNKEGTSQWVGGDYFSVSISGFIQGLKRQIPSFVYQILFEYLLVLHCTLNASNMSVNQEDKLISVIN